ncbi:MAG: hypothetical protein ACXV0U_03525 [Kineosporiaceae bacterium]
MYTGTGDGAVFRVTRNGDLVEGVHGGRYHTATRAGGRRRRPVI